MLKVKINRAKPMARMMMRTFLIKKGGIKETSRREKEAKEKILEEVTEATNIITLVDMVHLEGKEETTGTLTITRVSSVPKERIFQCK